MMKPRDYERLILQTRDHLKWPGKRNQSKGIGKNKLYSITLALVGNLYDEASILEAAKAYQDKTFHNKKHPIIFNRD